MHSKTIRRAGHQDLPPSRPAALSPTEPSDLPAEPRASEDASLPCRLLICWEPLSRADLARELRSEPEAMRLLAALGAIERPARTARVIREEVGAITEKAGKLVGKRD